MNTSIGQLYSSKKTNISLNPKKTTISSVPFPIIEEPDSIDKPYNEDNSAKLPDLFTPLKDLTTSQIMNKESSWTSASSNGKNTEDKIKLSNEVKKVNQSSAINKNTSSSFLYEKDHSRTPTNLMSSFSNILICYYYLFGKMEGV